MKLGTKLVMILLFRLISTLLVSSILAATGGQDMGDSCHCTYSKADETMLGCRYFAPFCSIMRNSDGHTITIINAYVVTSCTNGIIEPDCISCPTTTQSQLPFNQCPYVFVQEKCENEGATRDPAVNRETSSTRTNPQGLTGNETTTIIGAVVGSVLGAILILLLILLICCLLKRRSTQKETDEYQGCTVDQGCTLPPAFSFDNPEYSQPPSGDSKKYEQLNPITIEKNTNNYESLNRGGEYDNDIPSIVKDASDVKSYDNMTNKKDDNHDIVEPTNNVSSPGNVYTDFMGNNSMTGEAENKSDPPVSGNDDTTLIDNSMYGSDEPAAETIQGNDDTILVENSLYGSGRD